MKSHNMTFQFMPLALLSFRYSARERLTQFGKAAVFISAGALIAFCIIRYLKFSSFWLDEAFVAASLREPTCSGIFARLAYAQYFPRIYLACIAGLREFLGYRIWVLRLLPSVSFVTATVIWARLLCSRSRSYAILGILGAGMLLGASFWLDQGVQLKQYTLDVLVALVPFIVDDRFFEEALSGGKQRVALAGLALPCCFSYNYPIALFARILGWYIVARRTGKGELKTSAVLTVVVCGAVALSSIYVTDYRFNLSDAAAYRLYWRDCSLNFQFHQNLGAALRLVVKFLWGWHGRMPIVTVGMATMQALGVRRLWRQFKRPDTGGIDGWGSRSMGSLLLLVGTITASLLLGYPICAGRTTLFCQVHLQIVAIEGGLVILGSGWRPVVTRSFLSLFACVVLASSVETYVQAIQARPAEDLSPVISLIEQEKSDTVWVHPCSCAQVQALPESLPVNAVHLGNDEVLPPAGKRTWVIWTHLGDRFCRGRLSRVRCMAKQWHTAYETNDSGLALAEF